MTPLEFLARLAALVPPPRFPLIRFHGVFAPHSKKRVLVVPGRGAAEPERERPAVHSHEHSAAKAERGGTPAAADEQVQRTVVPAAPPPSPTVAESSAAAALDDDAESADDAPLPSRIDWATLLRRVYDVDALACPCGGRLEMLELVTDKAEVRATLERLRLDDEPPEPNDEGDPHIRGP
jgi:hypothetical protein